ncbi:MAG: HD domain-containing protein [Nitrospirota bacterium]
MDPYKLLGKYYFIDSSTYNYLITHSRAVAALALKAAERVKHLNPDCQFIEEASLLHDIGIFKVNAPKIGCIGPMLYVEHGHLGRDLLEGEGYPRHALVCERHVGCGLSVEDIKKHGLSLPERDMIPVTLEEKIICWADKFFSKVPSRLREEKPLPAVRKMVEKYGDEQLKRFDEWQALFGQK